MLRWEFRQRRIAIMWWTLATVVLIGILFLVYPSISGQLSHAIDQLPRGIRNFKNGNTASTDISSPSGYLNSQIYYITLPIILIILAITRGSALIGREEQDHTLELLLARPISRGRLLLGKAASGLSEAIIVTLGSTIVALALNHLVKLNISAERLILVNLYAMLFSLSFGAIAFALTAAGRLTKRMSTAIAVFIAFGGYLLATLSSLTHWLILPSRFAPYHYYAPDNVLNGAHVTGLNIYLVGIFILTGLLAYFGFRRRDID
jgi:ABC-2 type transport system permease protein